MILTKHTVECALRKFHLRISLVFLLNLRNVNNGQVKLKKKPLEYVNLSKDELERKCWENVREI